ncbi:MAG TPA: TAXI family TRAP transporter solute-binding subunit [Firmicutes bacterium]|jgi:hypothetical protein|uniref:TAXI family TRAP transporter solute-binding subunit n=1 Tax=Gelria sp. Kuro-4 TaxID=2796927 RepID=UPI00198CE4C9|nr:TAXI family TRAP transporter solute-binding subunit [Gelria sp. Kuro-4]MDI3521990.1 uncharacterized protein [Bacillota bacterium]MDK2928199.1 uncharacterized protein [Bacillota bacterium]BCV24160.1 C4-dicarboxylate ABC transporter substrate-binding protein [Gelria sp. Kuro-4]HHV58530.1 TAXI family TRAP transporter solute-binding subunit [Bacillota bacterium]
MFRSKWLKISLVLIVLVALLAGCSSAPKQEAKGDQGQQSAGQKEITLNIATATTGGVYYPLGGAFAQVWNKYVPGVKASAQATAGTPQNIELMRAKQAEIAFGQNGVSYYGYKGTEQFQGKAYPELRAMTALYSNVMQIVARKGAGIKSVADLKGKRFAPGAVASATEINSREILSVYGLNYMKDKGEVNVKADFVDYNAASDLLKNGQGDAYLIAGGLPTAAVMDTCASADVEVISLEPEKIKEITEKFPWYFEVVIPAGTYKGQDKDVHTVAVSNLLLCRADLPDDLVYNLTKALYDHHDELVAAHKAAKEMTIQNALNGMTVPLHPGAAKYLKEQGLNVDVSVK